MKIFDVEGLLGGWIEGVAIRFCPGCSGSGSDFDFGGISVIFVVVEVIVAVVKDLGALADEGIVISVAGIACSFSFSILLSEAFLAFLAACNRV